VYLRGREERLQGRGERLQIARRYLWDLSESLRFCVGGC
jgi:hypothetical protein